MTRRTARRPVRALFLRGRRPRRTATVTQLRRRGMVEDRASLLLRFARLQASPPLSRTSGPDSESLRQVRRPHAHHSAVAKGQSSTGPRLPPRSPCQARLLPWQAPRYRALFQSPCLCPSLGPHITHSGMAVYPPPSSLDPAIHTTPTLRPVQPHTRPVLLTAGMVAQSQVQWSSRRRRRAQDERASSRDQAWTTIGREMSGRAGRAGSAGGQASLALLSRKRTRSTEDA